MELLKYITFQLLLKCKFLRYFPLTTCSRSFFPDCTAQCACRAPIRGSRKPNRSHSVLCVLYHSNSFQGKGWLSGCGGCPHQPPQLFVYFGTLCLVILFLTRVVPLARDEKAIFITSPKESARMN